MTRSRLFVLLPLLTAAFSAAAYAQQQMPAEMAAAASIQIEPALPDSPEKPAAQTAPAQDKAAAPAESKAVSAVDIAAVEWGFFKATCETKDKDVLGDILPQLSGWLRTYPDNEFADEALLLKANLHLKLGDYRSAVLDLLKLMQEYPGSESFAAASQLLSITADKEMSKKEKPVLLDISKAAGVSGRAEKLAFVLAEMAARFGKDFFRPLAAEFSEFLVRFPAYAGRDGLELALGNLYSLNKEYLSARLAYDKVIYVYPSSPLMAKTKKLLADVLAENINDDLAAIKVYKDITEQFPGTPEAWAAYLQLPKLTEKKKQYPLAIEVYENIIKLYPDKAEAREAFRSEARVLREELGKPAEAIAVLNRLADKYKDDKVVEELYLAAKIAKKDMKDLDAEIKSYDRIASDYAGGKEAPKALLEAGQAYEGAKNIDKAKEYYEKIVKEYPEDAMRKKADKYLAALAPKL